MKVVVGLGNIGKEYTGTRHNLGFSYLDSYASTYKLSFSLAKKQNCLIATSLDGEKTLFVKTLSYVNNTGIELKKVVDYYHIELKDILVISDDINLPVGKIRFRQKGSAGGHNGLKSIFRELGTEDIARLRVGVSRTEKDQIVDFVLGKFNKQDLNTISDLEPIIFNIIDCFRSSGKVEDLMSTLSNND